MHPLTTARAPSSPQVRQQIVVMNEHAHAHHGAPPSSPQVRQQIVVMNEVFESHNRATWSSKAMLQVHATDWM